MIIKIIIFFTLVLSVGCSLKDPKDINSHKLMINLEKQNDDYSVQNVFSSTGYYSLFLPPNANGDPQSINDISCFAINVTGSGILQDNDLHDCRIIQPFNMHGVGQGKISEMAPSGSMIQLDVQPGFNRRIDVYGVYPTTLTCNNNDEIPAAQKGYYLGGLTTDLLGDTSVNIPVTYNQSTPNIAVVCDKDLLLKFGIQSAGHRIYTSNAATLPSTPTSYPTVSETPSPTEISNISYGDGNYVIAQGGTSSGGTTGYAEVHFNVTSLNLNDYDGLEMMVNAVTNTSGTLSAAYAQLYINGSSQFDTAISTYSNNNNGQIYISQNNLSNLSNYVWLDTSAQSSSKPFKFIVVRIYAANAGSSYSAYVNEVRLSLHRKPPP